MSNNSSLLAILRHNHLHLSSFSLPFFAVEASDFAVTLFDGRGHIKSVVREGKGVWGSELNADAMVAYLQEIRVDKELRGQGIGSWVLRQLLTHLNVYLEVSRRSELLSGGWCWLIFVLSNLSPAKQGAQFIYTLPGTLSSEWPYSDPWASSDPYVDEKDVMYNRIVGFYRRVSSLLKFDQCMSRCIAHRHFS